MRELHVYADLAQRRSIHWRIGLWVSSSKVTEDGRYKEQLIV